MANLVKTFAQTGDFEANTAAEHFLEQAGFSVGTMQRGDPRGIMFGDCVISKWRNLHHLEKQAMHGQMTGNMREGPITVTIFESAPQEAKRDFHKIATQYSISERAEALR